MPEPLLAVNSLRAGYGAMEILRSVDLVVRHGEIIAVLGANGAGKSTLNRALSGVVRPWSGSIRFADAMIERERPSAIVARGLIHVPEGRRIFPNLTVRENLLAASGNRLGNGDPWTLEKIHALFPRLAERGDNMGNTLSGGEQQMLAIGRALMTNPRLLILDEATEGLAPLIRDEIWRCLSMLKARGQSVLVIDKNIENLTAIADRHYIIERGRAVWSGTSEQLIAEPELQHRYLGV
jgi:branched-chain amino acid transport system ATP-binding protein